MVSLYKKVFFLCRFHEQNRTQHLRTRLGLKMYIYKLLVRVFYNKKLFIIQSNVSNIPVGSIKIGGFSSWSFNISVLLRFGSVLELSLLSRPIAAPGVRPFVPKSSDEIYPPSNLHGYTPGYPPGYLPGYLPAYLPSYPSSYPMHPNLFRGKFTSFWHTPPLLTPKY